MRSHSTGDDRAFSANGQSSWVKVEILNSASTWIDLTSLYGNDFVETCEIDRSIDSSPGSSQVPTLTLGLRRRIWEASIAPDMSGARINVVTALIMASAQIRVSAQVQPSGMLADPGSWSQVFLGRITKVDSGADPMTINADGLIADLQTLEFEEELIYGVWQPSRNVLTGAVVISSSDAAQAPAAWWQAQGNFETGSTEPTWPATPTAGTTTQSDNGGTWKCLSTTTQVGTPMEVQLQMMLNDVAGDGAWSLYTPTSPSFEMTDYNQQMEPCLEAMQKIADLVGWQLLWRWDDGTSAFRLTLMDPDRANTTSSYTIPPSKYRPISTWSYDLSAVRNVILGTAYDPTTLDASGNPSVITSLQSDATSISTWGGLRRFMAIAEPAGSQINSQTKLDAMVAAVLSDLAQAPIDTTIDIELAWWFQLNDIVTVRGDGQVFDTDIKLAVVGIKDSWSQGGVCGTELTLHGKPASKRYGWHDSAAAFGYNGGPLRITGPRTPAKVTATGTLAGGAIVFQVPGPRDDYDTSELHISTSSGFTPSAATLKAVSRTGRFDLTGLASGTTYYSRIAHRTKRGVLSAYSAQGSFTAGKVDLAAMVTGTLPAASVGTGYAASDLGSGAIPSGVTIDPDRLSSGTIPSNVGILSSSVLVKLGTSGIDATKLSGTVPLTSLTGITGSQLSASAAIAGTQLAAGTVGSTQLAAVSGWTAPTLENSWSNAGGSWLAAGYRKDLQGMVHLRGQVGGGTSGSAVFNLPSGFRPSAYLQIASMGWNGSAHVLVVFEIHTNGDVYLSDGPTNQISLDNIHFWPD